MVPRFMVWATGRMNLPLTEMEKNVAEACCGRKINMLNLR